MDPPWRKGEGRGKERQMAEGRGDRQVGRAVANNTYSEDMKEDNGPTSFAFWRACFWLNAASASSSSWSQKEKKSKRQLNSVSFVTLKIFNRIKEQERVELRVAKQKYYWNYLALIKLEDQSRLVLSIMEFVFINVYFFNTLVSSCALARLSTAMAKKTFSRVSGYRWIKDMVKIVQLIKHCVHWVAQHWLFAMTEYNICWYQKHTLHLCAANSLSTKAYTNRWYAMLPT